MRREMDKSCIDAGKNKGAEQKVRSTTLLAINHFIRVVYSSLEYPGFT